MNDNRKQIKALLCKYKNPLLVTEYYDQELGGAEISIKSFMQDNFKTYSTLTFDPSKPKSKINQPISENNTFRFEKINRCRQWIQHHPDIYEPYDCIITQSLIAPFVVNSTNKPVFYLIRDEIQLNMFVNYYPLPLWFAKEAHSLIQAFWIHKYKKSNIQALKKAHLIVNSKYMQELTKQRHDKESMVWYPLQLQKKALKRNPKFILFIGGHNPMKGSDVVENIAKIMPHQKFCIVTKGVKKKTQHDNIIYLPWGQNMQELFKDTKCVIVPSKWNEAFGRIVIEARSAGIPCLTSNKGGLSEVNKVEHIVSTFEPKEWKNKIEELA